MKKCSRCADRGQRKPGVTSELLSYIKICMALGDENENSEYRKRIGDIACYLVFVESLNAR